MVKAKRPNLLALLLQDFFVRHLPNLRGHEPTHDSKLSGQSRVVAALPCFAQQPLRIFLGSGRHRTSTGPVLPESPGGGAAQ